MTLSVESVCDGGEHSMGRKQSDLDSGLDMEERHGALLLEGKQEALELKERHGTYRPAENHGALGPEERDRLFLALTENSSLLAQVEELKAENRRLSAELETKSRLVSTGNLMISTLTLMLRQREASYAELMEKYQSFWGLIGDQGPDAWALGLIKGLVQRLGEDGSEDSSSEANRLKELVGLLENSLWRMDRVLQREASWKVEMEGELRKLCGELTATMTANDRMQDKIDWYEERTWTMESNLRKWLRSNEQLKARLSELEDSNEELLLRARDKRRERQRKKRASRCQTESEETELYCPRAVDGPVEGRERPLEPAAGTEYSELMGLLAEERNSNQNLRAQLGHLNDQLRAMRARKEELEKKARNMTVLRKNFIKLALKHKSSVESKNANLLTLKETISHLKNLLKLAGIDFIERAAGSKLVLEAALPPGFSTDSSTSLLEQSRDDVVQFEQVSCEEIDSCASIPEELSS